MSSNSESGHAVNIANFKTLHDTCLAFGVVYDPSNTQLTLVNMLAQWTAANTAQGSMNSAIQAAKQPVNNRQIAFEPLNKIITRSLASLNSTDASDQVKHDAKTLADEIRGHNRNSAPPAAEGAEAELDEDFLSTSHMSFVQRVNNLESYVDLLSNIAEYTPNEADISVAGLTTLKTNLETANNAVAPLVATASTSRISRDHLLYDDETGIVDVAGKCKDYVKSIFGATAAEYRLVSGIKFRKNND